MTGPTIWPKPENPIRKITFALMAGFDAEGQPIYARGIPESNEELELIQSILEPLQAVPLTITSVAMGEVVLELEDGSKVTLQPVFRPALDTYADLFFVDGWQYPMPGSLSALLELWRKQANE